MTKCIAVLGAGGFAREMYWRIKATHPQTRIVFIDDMTGMTQIVIGDRTVPIVNDWKFEAVYLDGSDRPPTRVEEFVLGIGSPAAKKEMVLKALDSGL